MLRITRNNFRFHLFYFILLLLTFYSTGLNTVRKPKPAHILLFLINEPQTDVGSRKIVQ